MPGKHRSLNREGKNHTATPSITVPPRVTAAPNSTLEISNTDHILKDVLPPLIVVATLGIFFFTIYKKMRAELKADVPNKPPTSIVSAPHATTFRHNTGSIQQTAATAVTERTTKYGMAGL